MKKILSLQMLERPDYLPWMYADFSPVPESEVKSILKVMFSEEPRIFFLSKGVIDQVQSKFHIPDENDPESGEIIDPYENDDYLLLNLPFPSLLIESTEPFHHLSSEAPFDSKVRAFEDRPMNVGVDYQFNVLAIREIEPEKYVSFAIFMGYVQDKEDIELFLKRDYQGSKITFKDQVFFAAVVLDDSKIDGNVDSASIFFPRDLHSFAKALFEEMKSEYAVGKEKAPQRIRTGSGSDRKLVRIKNILHVAMKKENRSYAKSLGKEIEWTHRWEVMGHWRKVDTIGKDRNGEYGIHGYTWVVPHSKGPADKDLVKKIRVVRE